MRVHVLLFARYAERAGAPLVEIDAAEGATLAEIWDEIRQQFPALRGDSRPLMAIDRAYATPERVAATGMEIAFFPPVSGG
jgi:molybdopterin converting factor small subunit